MNHFLAKVLNKRGVERIEDLSPEEKETFVKWESILSKEQFTTTDVKEFCEREISSIEKVWEKDGTKADLIPYHVVYKKICEIIVSPRADREQLEKYLTNLIKE